MLFSNNFQGTQPPFKRKTHKMVKHTQTIRRQKLTDYLSVFDHLITNVCFLYPLKISDNL